MKKYLQIYIVMYALLAGVVSAQVKGSVSYISSQHYYIRFNGPNDLAGGDTLFTGDNIPVLIIKFTSERSAACTLIGNRILQKGQEVYGNRKPVKNFAAAVLTGSDMREDEKLSQEKHTKPLRLRQEENNPPVVYNARLSVQDYSTYSNYTSDIHRSRYTLSGRVENIADVFSFSTFMNYSKNASVVSFYGRKQFNIYDLNVSYHPAKSFNLWFGRYLNPRISSLSTVDGIQTEKKIDNYFAGLLIGSRPDLSNMGYNIKLLEYGAYAGRSDTLSSGFMESTIAFLQQTRSSAIDRRFIYFQHQNNLFSKLTFFLSSEIDIYARERGIGKNKLTLTSLFFLSRYAPLRELSFSLSYDARKNVIYYETFKNLADSILDKETRQGFRAGIHARPINQLSVGINAGYRYKRGDLKPSRNINSYISFSYVPVIRTSVSLNFSKLITGYLDGLNYGISFNKELFNFISLQTNIRRIEYTFSAGKMNQDIISADLSFRLSKTFYLMGGYELTLEKKLSSQRILIDLTARL